MSFDEQDWWRPVGGSASHQGLLERRSLVWNDDGVVDRALFPILGTNAVYKGKFFPRGCRGMIEEILIYRTATAGGTITLVFSPHPCLGPLYTVVIPAGPANAWTAVAFEQMWNYDSLFIWVLELEAGEEWGYDAALPWDGHISEDTGATWAAWTARPFIRVCYTGETPGDVPVSGIINNIPIPSISSMSEEETVAVNLDTLTLIATVTGSGYIDMIMLGVGAGAGRSATRFDLYADGVRCWHATPDWLNSRGFSDTTQPVTLIQYGLNLTCRILISKRWEFKRTFQVYAYNLGVNSIVNVYLYPNLIG